jgi:predicted protein tyrosine phosphatase
MVRIRLLFVCSHNRLRGPTGERIFATSERFEVRSRGLRSTASRPLTRGDVTWADVIFVMEPEHKRELMRQFRELAMERRIFVLDIPDDYAFMDPELVQFITAGVYSALAESAGPRPSRVSTGVGAPADSPAQAVEPEEHEAE